MKTKQSSTRSLAFVALGVIAGGLFAAPTAFAADDDIVVTAPFVVHRHQETRSYAGIPIETVSLSQRVSYSDLDLRQSRDAYEMQRRIAFAARQSCRQLDAMYPDSLYPRVDSAGDCYRQAVREANAQLYGY